MKRAFILCDLANGDGGKGRIVELLTIIFGIKMLTRFSGGPQARHHVQTHDGRLHGFAQYCSGMFIPDTHSYLASTMLVNLETLWGESLALDKIGIPNAMERLSIDPDCLLVTPMHEMINQMQEIARGANAHGSCGMGVGLAVLESEQGHGITIQDLMDGRAKLKLEDLAFRSLATAHELMRDHPSKELRDRFQAQNVHIDPTKLLNTYGDILQQTGVTIEPCVDAITQTLDRNEPVLFEPAQGAHLDRHFGFSPHVTKTRCTYHHARDLLVEACVHGHKVEKIGVMRAYAHRHGAGPFVTEDLALQRQFPDRNNKTNRFQGAFRVGHLDLVALRYGIALNDGLDGLAITCLDQLSGLPEIRICTAYEYEGSFEDLDAFFEWKPVDYQRAEITAIKRPGTSLWGDERRTNILKQCKPKTWLVLKGWSHPLRGIRNLSALPRQVGLFLNYLQSPQGLDVPIKIIAFGPTAPDSLFLDSLSL